MGAARGGRGRSGQLSAACPPQASAAAATAELLKRQEELNRKAEELDRRERELQNAALGSGASECPRGGGPEPLGPLLRFSASHLLLLCSETEQLAPAAVLLPREALLLPGHPRGDPR